MRIFLSSLAFAGLFTSPLAAADPPKPLTPGDIVAAAPQADWSRIAPADLMVMDLAPDAKGRARRVVIQLMPAPFLQGWTGNIRKLVAARWFDGIAVVRVQDNYVVQWGDPDGETPGKAKALPQGLSASREQDYAAHYGAAFEPPEKEGSAGYILSPEGRLQRFLAVAPGNDDYAPGTGILEGWPIGLQSQEKGGDAVVRTDVWPVHCYGMVGVGRNVSPDTGTGAELYTVIGQAPRQLDRNIALVGRIIAGMENLSSLPRGTGALGFYETAQERTPIVSVRMGDEVPGLPAYEYLSTGSSSFAAYAFKRANRKDDFYIRPAGGVDVCNVQVPVREAKR
ncbi:peptidylprolyl isomerase [Novosphingobium barchaimii LL02]|uniref:peptidylprolyl isomerase n=1 Tax=Novosphingobium barchaimii LL02 TaxID=1114963 RepID=A0A0J7XTS6_9SPHN|nr:peptidylprolyl isomerase [Novosphingobium barchaimii]KMS55042.1 peptidylprolyl isomerase [Novosphingobium barchaimii LL02]